MGAALPVTVGLAMGERPGVLALVGIVVAIGAVALVSGALGTHVHNTPTRIVVLAVFVGACFADEGPTMKRFRPRARGRATRIRSRQILGIKPFPQAGQSIPKGWDTAFG